MTGGSTYETMRQLVDSWGLAGMTVVFLVLCLWPLRPGARDEHTRAANSILEDDHDGE